MKKLETELIQEASIEYGIAPAFIEKDYYIVEILKILHSFQNENFSIAFSGGTSLSKCYGIINRFSEDIDFMISSTNETRSTYKTFKKHLFEAINSTNILKVSDEDQLIRNESKFMSFFVDYPKTFNDNSLRQQVKIEISAKNTKLIPEVKKTNSWINLYLNDINDCEIFCVNPLETAANKFNAFLWRADVKDRTSELKKFNDPTIIRHLYDLYKLNNIIKDNKTEFYKLVSNIYEDDKLRGNKENTLSLKNFSNSTLYKIQNDRIYEEEYNSFVKNMIYKQTDMIPYKIVLEFFEQLINELSE